MSNFDYHIQEFVDYIKDVGAINQDAEWDYDDCQDDMDEDDYYHDTPEIMVTYISSGNQVHFHYNTDSFIDGPLVDADDFNTIISLIESKWYPIYRDWRSEMGYTEAFPTA